MRLWSLHPKYLDTKGLVALWREGLLAKRVLEDRTKGYRNHPQLQRFKEQADPVQAIHFYLCKIHEEATKRNYRFDEGKLNWSCASLVIPVTKGQVKFEAIHLSNKLKERDTLKYKEFKSVVNVEVHPIFCLIDGPVESWEII